MKEYLKTNIFINPTMGVRKNTIDGIIIISTLIGISLIYWTDYDVWGTILLVIAILVGWFRRAIYRAWR